MTTGKAFFAVLAGVATGTALGLILASRSMNSRKKISRVGKALGEALNDKIDERFDEMVMAIAGNMKPSKRADEKVEQPKTDKNSLVR